MSWSASIAAATSVLGFIFALALLDQYRTRRHAFQLVWALGMVFYGLAAGCEAVAASSGWNGLLFRTYYLTGAVWSVAWPATTRKCRRWSESTAYRGRMN